MKEDAAAAVPSLIARLNDEEIARTDKYEVLVWDVTVGDLALEALCQIGRPAVEPCLAEVTHGTKVRYSCLMVLGRIKAPQAVDAIVAHLASPDVDHQCIAARAVLNWNHPRFLEPLLQAVNSDKFHTREAAVQALGNHRDARVIEPLTAALKDKDSQIQKTAAESLGRQEDPRAAATLRRILDDASQVAGMRRACAEAIGIRADPEALDHLFAVLKGRAVPDTVRSGAAIGIGRSRELRFVEPLLALAADKTDTFSVRYQILNAVVRLAKQDAIKPLQVVANAAGDDMRVRCFAVMHIIRLTDGKIDNAKFLSVIDQGYVVQDGFEYPRDRAVRKIAHNGLNEAVRNAAKAQLKTWGVSETYVPLPGEVEK